MTMTRAEIARKASVQAARAARRRRFERYAAEMSEHPADVPADLTERLITGLRASGWTLTAPRSVGESKELATTQPTRR